MRRSWWCPAFGCLSRFPTGRYDKENGSAMSTYEASRLGFVGVGRMGAAVALRLHEVGYAITAVYDVDRGAAQRLGAHVGAAAVSSLARVSEEADVIVTVVTDDAAQEAVFATSGDSLLCGCAGKTFINCATISPQVHQLVQERCKERGASSLEACMASSIPQARDGTLYLMVGGERDVFERVRPLLERMSASLRYVGPAGEAAKVKALVNLVMNINTAGLAEGLGLGAALGLDLDMLREVFSQTGARSRVLETDGADMQQREHETYFSAAHAAKDVHIATALADSVRLELPLAQATARQYDRLVELGLGELDKSAVAELTFPTRRAAQIGVA
ncbi:MAG TPA: NAD(P)-dependent oxidoreductase [Candidatus Acidoferrales bacterium]|nr:NAD(P)-dependent oxidoreductase [Candidatus Acidoferrales bacterium]